MTLAQISARASSIAMFSTGSADDVRDLASCVAALAKQQMAFADIVHDGVCMAAPKLGLAISDWRENQEEQNT